MMKDLGLSGTCAEIGVFRGDFARELLSLCPDIKKLHLVDIWSPGYICSGNQDGNNIEGYDGLENYYHVMGRFHNNDKVVISRMHSSVFFAGCQDNTLDAVYIDSDHSYKGALDDLENAWLKVKCGGWILGHDYLITSKCMGNFDFGVHEAVDDFVKKHNLSIYAIAMDGCASFAIRVPERKH